jgi:hypothetical protein
VARTGGGRLVEARCGHEGMRTLLSAAGVVLVVVAIDITAIAVFVVILGPVATDAAVAPWGRRDDVEDGGLAAEEAMLV